MMKNSIRPIFLAGKTQTSPARNVVNLVGWFFLAAIVVFPLLASWGCWPEKSALASKQQPGTGPASDTTVPGAIGRTDPQNSYSEDQLREMLLPQGSSAPELASQEAAIQYICSNPEQVKPFVYAQLAGVLVGQGDREWAAFWFYIFQSRSGAWVAKDPEPSATPALKASFNEVVGGPINQWIFSDLQAAHDLAARAIAYEKRFPFYKGRIKGVSDQEWQQALEEGRARFENGFNSSFKSLLADGVRQMFNEQRTANGLYVGPWQNPGKPLLDEWR